MHTSSKSTTRTLDPRHIAEIHRALDDLIPCHDGLPVEELLCFGKAVAASGQTLTRDLDSARQVGCPVVVVRPARAASPLLLERLSQPEREVASLVGRGLRNEDVASELGVSIATVKDHVHQVLAKTRMQSLTELVAALARESV